MSVLVRRTPAESKAYFEGCIAAYKHMNGHTWTTPEEVAENVKRIAAFCDITQAQLDQFLKPKEGPMKFYVASSWRCPALDSVFSELKRLGHEAYDFRAEGFSWRDVYPHCSSDETWTAGALTAALAHPVSAEGFERDMEALRACDVVLLVLPSGRSAHLEAGWAACAGKHVAVLAPNGCKPELMYRMTRGVFGRVEEAVDALRAAASVLR